MNIGRIGIGLFFIASALVMGLFELEVTPPLWWDEGWTLCVARQWVETGHYGCLLNGQPAPPILAGHFPVVASIAAGFRLFGVGVWQARLVELVYAFGALGLLYGLTSKLYSHAVALGTLGLLLFLPSNWQMHPLIMGRQVLGEMPMLFFFLAGAMCRVLVERHPLWWGGAVACWGIALMTKAQIRPFLTLALVMTSLVALLRGERRIAGLMAAGAAGGWVVLYALDGLRVVILQGHTLPNPPMPGLLQASALVLVPIIRLDALLFTLQFCLPTLCGLGFASWTMWSQWRQPRSFQLADAVRLMLLTFSLSWFGWFFLLSLGGARYAFPMWFVSAPFVMALFYDWSRGYDVRGIAHSLWSGFRAGEMALPQIKSVGAVLLVLLSLWMVVATRYAFRGREDGLALQEVVAYLHRRVPSHAMIETYESELLFLLNSPYHYPPAQLNVDFIPQMWKEERHLTYDALAADPDFLVVGEFGRWAGIYRSVIERGQMRLILQVGRYQVYERVRTLSAVSGALAR
ncbi:MAG: glycosyltransferase family 39 protein [Nitrospira sp.]|nr:glycosyltransferase family 39 protein [Nitrospira sp.]